MVDVRTLVDQATQTVAAAGEPLRRTASETADVAESLAEVLTSALRALPGKLRDMEVPRVKQSLEQVSQQLQAIAVRLRRLSQHLERASGHISDKVLQDSVQLVVEGIDALASVVRYLRPGEHSLFRFVPIAVAKPYLDTVERAELGLRIAGDLSRACVGALPDIGAGLGEIAEDLERAADLLDGTSNTIRELSGLFPI